MQTVRKYLKMGFSMSTEIAEKRIGTKENKAFMLLSAFGILFVVDEHLGRPISFLYSVFPYDSFYMPLFVFISGYFFHPKHCASIQTFGSFAVNRWKKTMNPYLFWILIYAGFSFAMRKLGIISFGPNSISELLWRIVTFGTSFGFNDPSWFVPTLFCTSVIYCGLRTAMGKYWKDTVVLLCLLGLGAASVMVSKTGFNREHHHLLLKICFFTQFYHLGYYFRQYLEQVFDRINGLVICACSIGINLILLLHYGYDIRFPFCARMGGFVTDNPFLPLITSVTAIAFWLKVSKMLAPALGNSRLVNFLSDNTFFIMTHHLTARALFNGLLILGKKYGITMFSAVNADAFRSSAWYIFSGDAYVMAMCFFFTLSITMLACYCWKKLLAVVHREVNLKKQS